MSSSDRQSNNPYHASPLRHLTVPSPPRPSASSPTSHPAQPRSSTTPSTSLLHPILDAQSEFFNNNPPSTQAMSNYSSPDEYSYTQLPTSRKIVSITEINQLHLTLRNRNVNTLTELRRIERTLSSLQNFAAEHMPEMTNAWSNYVNTNNLLSELRGLTRQYPFSSELLEDAKTRVFNDASSSRSWNFAWLILVKIRNEQMVPVYAAHTAQKPAMWGGVVPDQRYVAELAGVLAGEWSRAVDQLLKNFAVPPTLGGGW